jgi:hypothetical protein
VVHAEALTALARSEVVLVVALTALARSEVVHAEAVVTVHTAVAVTSEDVDNNKKTTIFKIAFIKDLYR